MIWIYRKLKVGLFFGAFIDLYLSTYFEFVLSSIFTFRFEIYDTIGEKYSFVIAIFSIIMTLVFIPYISIWIIFSTTDTLKRKDIKRVFGKFYEGVLLRGRKERMIGNTKWRIAYTLMITMRRLLIIILAMYVDSIAIQALMILCTNTVFVIYQGRNRPGLGNKTRRDNRIYLFNEVCVGFSTFFYLAFTGLIHDLDTQYTFGWVVCHFITFIIVVNMWNIL